jgi:hypothetical protein
MSYPLGSIDPDERADPALPDGGVPGAGARRLLRGLLSAALVLLVMLAFASGVWFAHVAGKRHGASADVPLLRADRHPFKIRPAAPGGMVVPDQNMMVYGERHEVVEHLLPPPETPMPRPAPPPTPKPAAPKPAPSQAAPAAMPAGRAPAVTRAPTVPAARDHATPARALTAAPAAAPATRPAAIMQPAPAKPGSGGVRLQLGAVKSPDLARREWQRLKEANADLLGDVPGFAIPTDLGGKGVYYRIETAPFADRAAAERICDVLKQRGSECVLGR